MHKIQEGSALVLAGDVRSAVSAVDEALVSGARMFGSLVETAQSLQPAKSHLVLGPAFEGLASVFKGRGDMVEAVKRMNAVKRDSNLDVVDLGCDNPMRVFTEAKAPTVSPVAAVE